MDIKRYTKRPLVIEAVQFWTRNSREVVNWIKESRGDAYLEWDVGIDEPTLIIETLEGSMVCGTADYIIKGNKGEFYPCREDIFEESYKEAQG